MEKKKEYNCGIVMPIANHQDYNKGHWQEIISIIKEVIDNIEEYRFKCDLVSESEGIIDPIHKHIVNNLFDADLVICDISSKNPNVFFELGMRLAFDKPIIIIKDDKTESPFDTSIIRYIEYDTQLRYANVLKFKEELEKSILATLEAKQKNPNFSPFLKFFKEIKYEPSNAMESEKIEVPSYMKVVMDKLEMIEANQQRNNKPIFSVNYNNKNKVQEAILKALMEKMNGEQVDIDKNITYNEITDYIFDVVPTNILKDFEPSDIYKAVKRYNSIVYKYQNVISKKRD